MNKMNKSDHLTITFQRKTQNRPSKQKAAMGRHEMTRKPVMKTKKESERQAA